VPDRRTVYRALAIVVVVLAVGVLLVQTGVVYQLDAPDSYERTAVTAYDDNGTELATVDVRIADTPYKRYWGLSNDTGLGADEGMLFVHAEEGTYGYVMRNMAFPIDIVFIGSDERVTTVHHASVPNGSADARYEGTGKWVLEVPRGWSNRTGLEAGDRIAIPAEARTPSG